MQNNANKHTAINLFPGLVQLAWLNFLRVAALITYLYIERIHWQLHDDLRLNVPDDSNSKNKSDPILENHTSGHMQNLLEFSIENFSDF